MWKLFYYDRTTFSSKDGSWADAPAWGVMGVAHVDDVVGYSRDTGDFYIIPPWSEDQPWSTDHWGLMDYLLWMGELGMDETIMAKTPQELVDAGVKFGRSVRSDVWQEILRWMADDPELPRKSARYRHERP